MQSLQQDDYTWLTSFNIFWWIVVLTEQGAPNMVQHVLPRTQRCIRV